MAGKQTDTSPTVQVGSLVRGFTLLLAFLAVGEWLAWRVSLPIPGNVIGMALLTVALLTGIVRLRWVADAADALLSRLGLFFVPPGVGVMLYFDLIREEWWPLAGAVVIGSLAVVWSTGLVANWLKREGA